MDPKTRDPAATEPIPSARRTWPHVATAVVAGLLGLTVLLRAFGVAAVPAVPATLVGTWPAILVLFAIAVMAYRIASGSEERRPLSVYLALALIIYPVAVLFAALGLAFGMPEARLGGEFGTDFVEKLRGRGSVWLPMTLAVAMTGSIAVLALMLLRQSQEVVLEPAGVGLPLGPSGRSLRAPLKQRVSQRGDRSEEDEEEFLGGAPSLPTRRQPGRGVETPRPYMAPGASARPATPPPAPAPAAARPEAAAAPRATRSTPVLSEAAPMTSPPAAPRAEPQPQPEALTAVTEIDEDPLAQLPNFLLADLDLSPPAARAAEAPVNDEMQALVETQASVAASPSEALAASIALPQVPAGHRISGDLDWEALGAAELDETAVELSAIDAGPWTAVEELPVLAEESAEAEVGADAAFQAALQAEILAALGDEASLATEPAPRTEDPSDAAAQEVFAGAIDELEVVDEPVASHLGKAILAAELAALDDDHADLRPASETLAEADRDDEPARAGELFDPWSAFAADAVRAEIAVNAPQAVAAESEPLASEAAMDRVESSAAVGDLEDAEAAVPTGPAQAVLFESGPETDDAQYRAAVQIVVEANRCSVAMLQRSLRVSFSEATALIERMYDEGLVGPQLPSGRRKILAKKKAPPAP